MKSVDEGVSRDIVSLAARVHLEVERIRKDLPGASLVEAASMMRDLATLRENLADVKTALEKLNDTLRFGTIPDLMTDIGATSTTLEGIGRVGIVDDVQVSTPADKKQELEQWLVDRGFEDMISHTVNAQTLAAFVRRRLKEGKELPSGLLNIKPITRASITVTHN